MQYFNNILCFEAGWLIENDIITKPNYDWHVYKKHFQILRRASRNTPALVSYDSLPDRFKEAIVEKIGGNPYKLAKHNILEGLIDTNTDASLFFENYRLSDGRYLPKQTRHEYYTNAVILDAISLFITKAVAPKKAKGQKTGGSWEYISEAVKGLDCTQYPHTLPVYATRLRDKYNLYQKEGFSSLVHKNFANKNAAKVDDRTKESILVELLADPRNFDNERIARFYNQVAGNAGWQNITRHAVAKYRDKYDLEIHAGRRGVVSLMNDKLMQVKRFAPTRPLYYWTLDGWDVELFYQKTENGRTTYTNRVTVVVVLDPCGKYPIGYAIGDHETPDLIKEALRNAVKHTSELFGSMYRSHQVQSDRYGIKKMTPLYEAVAKISTPARAHNAKSKVIEPYFEYMNTEYCKIFRNWSGYGIEAKKDSQPNDQALNHYKKQFPDYEGVCKQVATIIMEERKKKVEKFVSYWSEMNDDDKLVLSYEQYLYHFGISTGRTNLMQGSGLHVTIKGIKRAYDSFDLLFRQHMSTQWAIMYDPDDTSKILAMNEDNTRRFVLDEKYLQPMALKDRKDGDSEQLQRVNQFNKEAIGHITDFRTETSITAREFFMKNKELDETLAKFVITDNNGQHKDNKNLGRARNKPIEIEAVPISVEQKAELQDIDIFDLM